MDEKPKPKSHSQINQAHEVFLQEIYKGKTQLEAFRIANPNSRYNDKNAVRAASILFNKPKLKARWAELKADIAAETVKKCLWSREQAKEQLDRLTSLAFAQIERGGDVRGVGGIINQNIVVMNKMFGVDLPEKDDNAPVPVAFNYVPVKKEQ